MDHPSDRPAESNLDDLFTYHPPHGDDADHYEAIRSCAKSLVVEILGRCPACADTTAAVRKVREAVMTANAAIALEPTQET